MFYTYIVTNKRNGTLYTGHTDDIGIRTEQHKFGLTPGFASKYGCNRLVWYETYPTRDSAFRRERQIKAWKRAWKVRLIEKANPNWLDIANMMVWPLPKGAVFDDLRRRALRDGLQGETNPNPYLGIGG